MGLADFERSTHSPVHSSFHLARMGLLIERLGNPHLGVPTVHIAGTKGKGSTAAMVTSILAAAGYKVGLYTSPHLHSAVERIRIGLDPIEQKDFAVLVEQSWPDVLWVGEHGGYGGVTTFELLTAMAFLYFKQIEADIQVIEVGLGGRLDSTNIVRPNVCTITSISLDHVTTLGKTIDLIAFEKAGIIKTGAPVIVAPQPDEAMRVFREIAEQREAPLISVADRLAWRSGDVDASGQAFHATGLNGSYNLWIPLLGDYQLENACTAVATVETLANNGFEVSDESIVRGMAEVAWPARMQVLSRTGPLVVVDGAHNPYSVGRMVEALRQNFRFDKVVLVFGALGGHSAQGMLEELAVLSPKVVAVRSRHPRSAPARDIAELVNGLGMPVIMETEKVGDAVRKAVALAGENDLVLGTGSLSVSAEVIEEFTGVRSELYPNIKPPEKTGAITGV
jgi:dihydrofolate synthase/folylpolyglutamate synthase